MEAGDSGSSSSPDRKLATESSESLFRPEPSSAQLKSGRQTPSSSQQESSSPVLPVAAASPVIHPSISSNSSREEVHDEEDKVTDKVQLSATKTCDKGDNYVAAVDRLKPNTALVTSIPDDKPDEVASGASGDVTVLSGILFYAFIIFHQPFKGLFQVDGSLPNGLAQHSIPDSHFTGTQVHYQLS